MYTHAHIYDYIYSLIILFDFLKLSNICLPYVLTEHRVCSHKTYPIFYENIGYVLIEHITILKELYSKNYTQSIYLDTE